jgi:hypothetical protein
MSFDAAAVFANLAEKERIKGHHSPEGRAIRTLSRALNGWSAGAVSRRDVMVLCDQAVQDWLNARLGGGSVWSARTVESLASDAIVNQLITPAEADRLVQVHRTRLQSNDIRDTEISDMLEFCIGLIDKRW